MFRELAEVGPGELQLRLSERMAALENAGPRASWQLRGTSRAAAEVPRAGALDVTAALLATAVVVGASVAMELTASTLGTRHRIPEIVTGALVLAAVTSLPNAVSAVYLAMRGRGAATLSIALNSNAINVAAGLLIPGVIVGLGAPSGQGTLVASSYFGLTAVTLLCAYVSNGLRRAHGTLIIGGYLAFVAAVLIVS